MCSGESVVELESVRLGSRDQLSHVVGVCRDGRHPNGQLLQCASVPTMGTEHATFGIVGEPAFQRRSLGADEQLRDAFPEVSVWLVTKLLDDVVHPRGSRVQQQGVLSRGWLNQPQWMHRRIVPPTTAERQDTPGGRAGGPAEAGRTSWPRSGVSVGIGRSDNGAVTGKGLCRAAERIVSGYFAGNVSLRVADVMPGRVSSVVARLRTMAAPSQVPETFIVKSVHPTFPGAADMLRNDWAALQLLTELAADGEPLCARFYGGDPLVPLVVMEDLGAGEGSPQQLVEGDDPDAATTSLLAYIRAVARLHVITRRRHDDYYRLRASLGPLPPPRPLYHDPWSDAAARTDAEITTAIGEYHAVLDSVGVNATPGVDAEIAAVTRRIEHDPGEFLALCQGDQNGQGGMLLTGGRLRMFDFGVGGFRHALIEGLPQRITWGCARRVPEQVAAAMDAAYQAVLIPGEMRAAAAQFPVLVGVVVRARWRRNSALLVVLRRRSRSWSIR